MTTSINIATTKRGLEIPSKLDLIRGVDLSFPERPLLYLAALAFDIEHRSERAVSSDVLPCTGALSPLYPLAFTDPLQRSYFIHRVVGNDTKKTEELTELLDYTSRPSSLFNRLLTEVADRPILGNIVPIDLHDLLTSVVKQIRLLRSECTSTPHCFQVGDTKLIQRHLRPIGEMLFGNSKFTSALLEAIFGLPDTRHEIARAHLCMERFWSIALAKQATGVVEDKEALLSLPLIFDFYTAANQRIASYIDERLQPSLCHVPDAARLSSWISEFLLPLADEAVYFYSTLHNVRTTKNGVLALVHGGTPTQEVEDDLIGAYLYASFDKRHPTGLSPSALRCSVATKGLSLLLGNNAEAMKPTLLAAIFAFPDAFPNSTIPRGSELADCKKADIFCKPIIAEMFGLITRQECSAWLSKLRVPADFSGWGALLEKDIFKIHALSFACSDQLLSGALDQVVQMIRSKQTGARDVLQQLVVPSQFERIPSHEVHTMAKQELREIFFDKNEKVFYAILTIQDATDHDVSAFAYVGIIRATKDGLSITQGRAWRVQSEGTMVNFFNGNYTKIGVALPKVIPEFDSYEALEKRDRSGLLRELKLRAENLKIHERLLPYISTTAP